MSDIIRTIDPNDKQLNDLFKELLDGLRDDMAEANENVLMYQKSIEEDDMGKEMWGQLLNAALTIKGSARDKQLKFLNMFKERVTRKEQVKIAEEAKKAEANPTAGVTVSDMNKMLEEMQKNGELDNLSLDYNTDEDE